MFYQIFLSPQVKRCAVITLKHGICELPRHFRRWGAQYPHKKKRLKILGNIRKLTKLHRMIAHCPALPRK